MEDELAPAAVWLPIDTAPRNKWILCWWTPVSNNPWAETVVKCQIMSPPDLYVEGAKPLTYWDGEEWPIERLTHWMPVPERPADRPDPRASEATS